MSFEFSIEGGCQPDGQGHSLLSQCPILDPIPLQPPDFLTFTPNMTPASHFQMSPMPSSMQFRGFLALQV